MHAFQWHYVWYKFQSRFISLVGHFSEEIDSVLSKFKWGIQIWKWKLGGRQVWNWSTCSVLIPPFQAACPRSNVNFQGFPRWSSSQRAWHWTSRTRQRSLVGEDRTSRWVKSENLSREKAKQTNFQILWLGIQDSLSDLTSIPFHSVPTKGCLIMPALASALLSSHPQLLNCSPMLYSLIVQLLN